MIDAPPVNTTSPPDAPSNLFMGWHVVPSMWALGAPKLAIKRQAQRDLSVRLVNCAPWFSVGGTEFIRPTFVAHMRRCIEECRQCAGLIVLHDLSQRIPVTSANVINFFFGRDKAEALVYTWQPFEKNFRLVDQDWLNRRCGT